MNDDVSRQLGRSLLARTLSNPHAALGRIEGNVEAKALGPALAMLGWDLVGQVHWQFQLRSTPSALSADAVIGDAQGVWAVCETKALGALTQAAESQLLGYRDALSAPLALLTDGLRWRLWKAADTIPGVTCDAVDTEQLLAALAPHLDADTASASTLEVTRGVGVRTGRREKMGCGPADPELGSEHLYGPAGERRCPRAVRDRHALPRRPHSRCLQQPPVLTPPPPAAYGDACRVRTTRQDRPPT